MRGERGVGGVPRPGCRLFDEDFRPGKFADLGHRLCQIRQELKAIGVPLCQHLARPP